MNSGDPVAGAFERIRELQGARMYERALQEVHTALASMPDEAWLHAVRSDLLGALNQPALAVEAARHAVGLNPDLGYAHRVLADAAVDARLPVDLPVQAAQEAVRLDGDAHSYFTLVRAMTNHPSRRREAAHVAQLLGQEHPQSILAPLSMAVVEMNRGLTLQMNGWWTVVAVVMTRGVALVVYAVMWLAFALWRMPSLKRADQHLRRALEMDPSSAETRLLAAEALRSRFRFAHAVNHEVAAGAINANLVDAGEVARGIAQRTSIAAVGALGTWFVIWWFWPDGQGEVIGVILTAMCLTLLVTWSHFRQCASLPPPLRRALSMNPTTLGSVGAVAGVTVFIAWLTWSHSTDDRLAGIGSAAVVVSGFITLLISFVRARRAPY